MAYDHLLLGYQVNTRGICLNFKGISQVNISTAWIRSWEIFHDGTTIFGHLWNYEKKTVGQRVIKKGECQSVPEWGKMKQNHSLIWMFPKIMVRPKSSIFNKVFHYKPSILGYPYFWKHPYIPKPALISFCFALGELPFLPPLGPEQRVPLACLFELQCEVRGHPGETHTRRGPPGGYKVIITPTNPMKNHGCQWV